MYREMGKGRRREGLPRCLRWVFGLLVGCLLARGRWPLGALGCLDGLFRWGVCGDGGCAKGKGRALCD